MGDQNIRPHWRRSSFSTAGVDNCVEVAFVDHKVWVRDSNAPQLPALSFPRRTWRAFLTRLEPPSA
ncbi:DUF397 domain-containing protein [Streptomyces syringium]|uniref:DUF397 domain-containing protein n=1 Tax=Streptomyces syringium TaxID=76729 RepID=UPI0036643DD6